MAATAGLDRDGGIEAALALHRSGELEKARADYENLLAATPGDANLLGLLGVIALQRGQVGEAETLLRRALAAIDPDPVIHLRNANNLIALLVEHGRTDAAAELAGGELPDWPRDVPPRAAGRATLLSLAEALARFGHPARALSMLESAAAYLHDDAAALNLIGRLRLKCGDPQAALRDLRRACELDPANWQALAALSTANEKLNNRAAAREAARRCTRAAPIFVARRQPRQQARILVLNPAPSRIRNADGGLHNLHLCENYISQVSHRMADEFHFASVFADLPELEPPEADLVFNNMASGERMNIPGRLAQAVAVVDQIGLPVINHPCAVARMTRQRVAEMLQGIPGLRVPRIARYNRDLDKLHLITAEIAARFTYPVIVRHVAADESAKSLISEKKTVVLVNDALELSAFIRSVDWPQFYVIEYVNLRKADGNFRKLRAMFFADEIVVGNGAYYSEWLVGGWRKRKEGLEFFHRFPHLLDEINQTLIDPAGMLGPLVMPALEEIRNRVPLDVSGIDFDVDDDGRVVLFEVGATMNFFPLIPTPQHLELPPEIRIRINAAFHRLVRRTIARTGSMPVGTGQAPTP
jgi:tetratricopeptide (TPR) repeat protein